MTQRLLIVTSVWDSHADKLIELAPAELPGWEVVRLHPDAFATNINLSVQVDQSANVHIRESLICDSGRKIETPDVIWWRKPDWPTPHPSLDNLNTKECSAQEYKEYLLSFFGIFNKSVWVNDYWNMQRYSYKLNQVRIFGMHGFLVPKTIVPCKKSELLEFCIENGDIIAKAMTYDGFVENDEIYSCYTNVLTKSMIENITDEELSFAPIFAQERIKKHKEYRVTVIGQSVVWCSIKTNEKNPEGIDFRIVDPFLLDHEIVESPPKESEKLVAITKEMGLNFGTFDIIENKRGEYYILEINPNGQYLWIELITGAKLTKEMCNLIKSLLET